MRAQDRWCRLKMTYITSNACLCRAVSALDGPGAGGEGVAQAAYWACLGQAWLAWGWAKVSWTWGASELDLGWSL